MGLTWLAFRAPVEKRRFKAVELKNDDKNADKNIIGLSIFQNQYFLTFLIFFLELKKIILSSSSVRMTRLGVSIALILADTGVALSVHTVSIWRPKLELILFNMNKYFFLFFVRHNCSLKAYI